MISRRIRIVAIVIAILAVPILTIVLVVSPLQKQVATNNASRASVEQLNSQQTARNGELQSSDDQITKLQDEAAELDAALPAKPAIAALLTDLGTMSSRYGVKIMSFSSSGGSSSTQTSATPAPSASATSATGTGTTSTATSADVSAVPIELQVTGDLNEVQDFVGALQRATRLVTISDLTITGDTAGTFTGDIKGSTYVLSSDTDTDTDTDTTGTSASGG